MGIQSISTTVDLTASVPADLTTSLQDARLSDGYRVWVTQAGASHGLWVLDQTSVAVVDGITVVATQSGVGRWVLFGSGGGGGVLANISVANEAALTAFPAATLPEGTIAYVQSHRSYWGIRTQAVALLAHEIIASATAPAKQWNRMIEIPHVTFLLAATFNIDAVNGNDENDGTTNPLQTFGEYIRRCPLLYIPQTVNILTTLPDSDNLVYRPQMRWHQSLSATYPTLTIAGLRTLGANNVVVSSSDEAANVPPRIDLGIALTPGSILQATSGAQNGATAVVVSLVAGTNYNTSPWRAAAGGRTIPPIAGVNVAVTSRPTVNRVQMGSVPEIANGPVLVDLDIKVIAGATAQFQMCTFVGVSLAAIRGNATIYTGCGFSGNFTAGNGNGGSTSLSLCGMARTAATNLVFGAGTRFDASDSVLSNVGLDYSGNIANSPAAYGTLSSCGFLYANAGKALQVRRGAMVSVEGTLYGPDPGGASTGTDVREGGHIYVNANITPTLTGAVELVVEGLATGNVFTPATGVIAAAAALTTWAQWVATFTRNVLNYTTGASITNHA